MVWVSNPGRGEIFYTLSRQALGAIHPPVQLVLGQGVEHPLQSSAKVEERLEVYLCSSSGYSWPLQGEI